MSKLRDLGITGERLVCEDCQTAFTEALRGKNDGKNCPKCSGELKVRFIGQSKYENYEVDKRYF